MSDRLNQVLSHINSSTMPSEEISPSPTAGSYNASSLHPAAMVSEHKASVAKAPMSVCVTGAAGNIGYALVFMIAQGKLLGDDQPIELRLLDIPPMAKALDGLKMELLDGAFPCLHKIVPTTDYKTAFLDLDIAMLVGARPRGPGMQRADLLKANGSIFSGQGKALNDYAKRSVKVLVVGNPANTNCLIAMANAPSLPPTAFSAMTRLDENRAKSQLADRLGVPVHRVRNVVIWGNHSNTQFPDVAHGLVLDHPQPGQTSSVRAAICDDAFLDGPFLKTVATRGGAIIEARGKSSAASAASSAMDHIRNWVLGSNGDYVSMAVPSDGSYGIPKGLIFSFPVICSGGSYTIVQGLKHTPWAQEKLNITRDELLSEKADVQSMI
eukprot:gb/GEZN01009796.1/.p1 GENE.gb/GEZN01009796.1/~~gb/GEZN01009796.1/.p1  ORF type:complete len:389 (+),score=51.31 gb/GEZN01009796.1/:24-1169(+)